MGQNFEVMHEFANEDVFNFGRIHTWMRNFNFDIGF